MKKRHIAGLCASTVLLSSGNVAMVSFAEESISLNEVEPILCLIDSKPSPKEAIKRNVEGNYEWIDTPDTSKKMHGKLQNCKAKVSFKGGGQSTFTVPVKVVERYSEGFSGDSSEKLSIKEDQIKPIVKIVGEDINEGDLDAALPTLPDNTKKEIVKKVNTSRKGEHKLGIKLSFYDGNTQTVHIPVTVTTKDDLEKEAAKRKAKDSYEAEKSYYKNLSPEQKKVYEKIGEGNIATEVVRVGGKIDLTDNIYNLPKGTRVKEVKVPSTDKEGEFKGTVEVTFPNGETLTVDIPVSVLNKDAKFVSENKKENGLPQNEKLDDKGKPSMKKEKEKALGIIQGDKIPSNNPFNQDLYNYSGKGEKGTPLKGEMVKTGERAKKGIIAGVSVFAAIAAFATFYLRKKKK